MIFSKATFLSMLTSAVALTSFAFARPVKDIDPGRIIGGREAEEGDYPYFVDMDGCGGTLIAPDIVLSAAHCGSRKGINVIVGAYRNELLAGGGQRRTCVEYIQDPRFDYDNGNFDFSLCKLDEPVTIDSNIKIELNEDDTAPEVGEELVNMGVGKIGTGESMPIGAVLKEITGIPISNDECSSLMISLDFIFPTDLSPKPLDPMFCTLYEDPNEGLCNGDSGGPVIRRTEKDDGTIVDTHMGLVSYGSGCADQNPGHPNVHARTSFGVDWIKKAACDMGSIADFCSDFFACEEAKDFLEDVVDDKLDTIIEVVEENLANSNSTNSAIEDINETLDAIDKVVNETQKFLDFISCGYDEPINFVRNGCDGLDNDCDSQILDGVNLVDECDEDQIPPTITLAVVPPTTFLTILEAETWYLKNTIVSDDCAPSNRLVKSIIDSSSPAPGRGEITMKVDDTRCANNTVQRLLIGGNEIIVDGIGHATSTETFTFDIDSDPPIVTCGFGKPQDENYSGGSDNPLFIDRYNERADVVDVEFFYKIEESSDTLNKDVQVSLTVSSNEFEKGEREMVEVVEQRNIGGPSRRAVRVNTFFAPLTCGDDDAGGFCLRETGSDARFYDITIVATDPSGNVGSVTCTVAVVPEYDCAPGADNGCDKSSKKSKSSDEDKVVRPKRNALIRQLESSEQRYKLDEIEFVWNTSEDDSMVPRAVQLPTISTKSSKKTKSSK